jgi:hypothetical protein
VCVHVCVLLRCASLCVLCMCATVLRLSLRVCACTQLCAVRVLQECGGVVCVVHVRKLFSTVPLYLAARERTPAHVDYLLLYYYYLLVYYCVCTTTVHVCVHVYVCVGIHTVLYCC